MSVTPWLIQGYDMVAYDDPAIIAEYYDPTADWYDPTIHNLWVRQDDHIAETDELKNTIHRLEFHAAALEAEVERLNRHRDELAADKHRLLLEIRALDDALEQLKQRNRELEAKVANWRHVMEDA